MPTRKPTKRKPTRAKQRYEEHRERVRVRSVAESKVGRDIGKLPPVAEPKRREAARLDFRCYCESYLPQTFCLPWSADHLKLIGKIEDAVLRGGLFAMATPRGGGKTSLCEAACLWALLYGHREFVALIAASEDHARRILASLKLELEANERLLADFPEACYPIQALEGIHQRAGSQLHDQQLTRLAWTGQTISLPAIDGSPSAGATVTVAGICGHIRGLKHKCPDGTTIRPSLVLIDDPQTDESAHSVSQCATRERILCGAVLGLAGPGKKIAGLMTLTVVRPGDLADRLLDRDKYPQWQGERTKMIYAWPSNDALWERYAELWRDGLRAGRGIAEATAFYAANRAAMDEGAVVAWSERHSPGELSGLQHAVNLRLERGEAAFCAEFQNQPLTEIAADAEQLTVAALAERGNGLERGLIPKAASHLTAYIDIHARLLYWLVVAWEQNGTGYIVDYGTDPAQRIDYYTLRDAPLDLATGAPGAGMEGAIWAGLDRLGQQVLAREWPRDGGGVARIERCLIDANWGQATPLVYRWARSSAHAGILLPAHGRYVGARGFPFAAYRWQTGDRVGTGWRIPGSTGSHETRHVVYDVNHWKSWTRVRLATSLGDRGALTLFGHKPETHRLLLDHLTSERFERIEARSRAVEEWALARVGADNHWWDCLVGCAVAGSVIGVGQESIQAPRRVSMAELQKQARRRIHGGREVADVAIPRRVYGGLER